MDRLHHWLGDASPGGTGLQQPAPLGLQQKFLPTVKAGWGWSWRAGFGHRKIPGCNWLLGNAHVSEGCWICGMSFYHILSLFWCWLLYSHATIMCMRLGSSCMSQRSMSLRLCHDCMYIYIYIYIYICECYFWMRAICVTWGLFVLGFWPLNCHRLWNFLRLCRPWWLIQSCGKAECKQTCYE